MARMTGPGADTSGGGGGGGGGASCPPLHPSSTLNNASSKNTTAAAIEGRLAGWVGVWVQHWLDPAWLRYLLAGSFFLMAFWMLIPDQLDDEDGQFRRYGAFITTFVLFFLAEMGDKTQLATVLLAARFVDDFWLVVVGTTLGMMAANVPVVLIGKQGAERIPMKWIHGASALLFILLGITTLWW